MIELQSPRQTLTASTSPKRSITTTVMQGMPGPNLIEPRPRKKVRFSFTLEGQQSSNNNYNNSYRNSNSDNPCIIPPSLTNSSPQTGMQDALVGKVQHDRRRPARRSRSPPTVLPHPDDNNNKQVEADCSGGKSSSLPSQQLDDLQHKLQRMERYIQASALQELELMNRAKRLRKQRAAMTRKYKNTATLCQRQQQQQDSTNGRVVVFSAATLPPLI